MSNPLIYSRSLSRIYGDWKANSGRWGNCRAMVLSLEGVEGYEGGKLTRAIQSYLFQRELGSSVVVLKADGVWVFADGQVCDAIQGMLGQINARPEEYVVPVSTLVEAVFVDGVEEMRRTFRNFLSTQFGEDRHNLVIGVVEMADGQSQWVEELKASRLCTVDVGAGFSELLSIKDEQEIRAIATAASITNALLSKVRMQMEKIIDDNCKMTHEEFVRTKIWNYLKDPLLINKKLSSDSPIGPSFDPIVQSGANCSFSGPPRDMEREIHFGVIVIDLGTKFRSYSSEIARTYLIDPSDYVMNLYDFLLKLQMKVINSLVPGAIFSQVYEEALKIVKKKHPELLDKFLRSCGWCTGILPRDEAYVLDASCDKMVQSDMVFVVRLGFENVPNAEGDPEDRQTEVFSLLLADTVHIAETKPQVLTAKAPKSKSEISYSIKEEEEESYSEELEKDSEELKITTRRSTRSATVENPEEQKQIEMHQKKLAEIQLAEMIKKYSSKNQLTADTKYELAKVFCSYPDDKRYPVGIKKGKILIDVDNETVFFPLFGQSVPFHIRTVKSVSKVEDFLKVNFSNPGVSQPNEVFVDGKATFIKEMMFQVGDRALLNEYAMALNRLKKKAKDMAMQKIAIESLVVQEPLQRAMNCMKKLPMVSIRPRVGTGKSSTTFGTLEAHVNGFSYVIPRRNSVDVIYKNVRYAFFQQAGIDEEGTLIHFHLYHAVMIGKKKVVDVQFNSRVIETVHDSSSRALRDDPDEILHEQRERERINMENNRFKAFCEETHNMSGIEFEQPYKELMFIGTYGRESVKLVPTTNCLVSLKTMPFLVLPLDDVEVVFFERVSFQTRYFDLTFVLKDYKKGQIHITDIFRWSYYDMIRRWLDSCDVKFYVSQVAIMWKPFMETICKDVLGFWKEGGWSTYENDALEDEEEEDDENDEDEFTPSDSESWDYDLSSVEEDFDDDNNSEQWNDEEDEELSEDELKQEHKESRKRQHTNSENHKPSKKRNVAGNSVDSFYGVRRN